MSEFTSLRPQHITKKVPSWERANSWSYFSEFAKKVWRDSNGSIIARNRNITKFLFLPFFKLQNFNTPLKAFFCVFFTSVVFEVDKLSLPKELYETKEYWLRRKVLMRGVLSSDPSSLFIWISALMTVDYWLITWLHRPIWFEMRIVNSRIPHAENPHTEYQEIKKANTVNHLRHKQLYGLHSNSFKVICALWTAHTNDPRLSTNSLIASRSLTSHACGQVDNPSCGSLGPVIPSLGVVQTHQSWFKIVWERLRRFVACVRTCRDSGLTSLLMNHLVPLDSLPMNDSVNQECSVLYGC